MTKVVEGALVTYKHKKEFGNGTSYSFKTDKTGDMWMRLGDQEYAGVVEKGAKISFTYYDKPTKSGQVDGKVTQVSVSAPPPVQIAAPQQTETRLPGPVGSGGFLDKALPFSHFEQTRQKNINYQSARKDAIEFLGLALGAGAVKFGKDEAKKLKLLEDLTDLYTARFFNDTQSLGAVKRIEEVGEPDDASVEPKTAAVAVAPAVKEGDSGEE